MDERDHAEEQPSAYMLRHLASHLAAAGRWEELHQLVAEGEDVSEQQVADEALSQTAPTRSGVKILLRSLMAKLHLSELTWSRTERVVPETTTIPRSRQPWTTARWRSEGSHAGYIEDVELILEYALQRVENARTEGEQEIALARCFRYSLIITSFNSQAGNHDSALVQRAVETGLWTSAQALAIAERIPDDQERVSMYRAILEVGALSSEQKRVAEEAMLASVDSGLWLGDIWGGGTLGQHAVLAPHFSGIAKSQLVAKGLQVAARHESETAKAQHLIQLAPHLSSELVNEALDIAQTIRDNPSRISALAAISPYLSDTAKDGIINSELNRAKRIWDDEERAQAVEAVSLLLTGAMKEQALTYATTAARMIRDERAKAWTLARLAACWDGSSKEQALAEALTAIQAIQEERDVADILTMLAPQLAGRLLVRCLTVVRGLKSENYRACVLTAMLPHLRGKRRSYALTEALEDARTVRCESDRAERLIALAPHLSGSLLIKGCRAARVIDDEYLRARALVAFIPHLVGKRRQNIMSQVLQLSKGEPDKYPTLLNHLAPYLSGKELAQGMIVALSISDRRARSQALVGLAPRLSCSLLAQSLAAVSRCDDGCERARALLVLVPYLADAVKKCTLLEAWAATKEVIDQGKRATTLIELASRLTDKTSQQVLLDALIAAKGVTNKKTRADILMELTSRLKGTTKERALPFALEAAEQVEDARDRAHALMKVAVHATGVNRARILSRALAALDTVTHKEQKLFALVETAPHLAGIMKDQVLSQALTMARGFEDARSRGEALATIAPNLASPIKEEVLSEALTSAEHIVSGNEHVTVNALIKVAEALPQSAAKLQVVTKALSLTESIPYDEERVRYMALGAIIPQLTSDLVARALSLALAFGTEYRCASALEALSPRLTGRLLEKAWERTEAMPQGEPRAKALVALVQATLVQQVSKLDLDHTASIGLQAILKLPESEREPALDQMAPYLTDELLTQALLSVGVMQDDSSKLSVLRTLTRHLPTYLLTEGPTQAQTIKDPKCRALALSEFAHRLADARPRWVDHQIRQAVGEHIGSNVRNKARVGILGWIDWCKPPLMASQAIAEVARALVDVGRWWP